MLKVYPNDAELNRFAAEKFVEIGVRAIAERGRFAVVLAGGSTPKGLYRLLASAEFRDRMDWTRCFFFFGDERNVAADDEESNFRMAEENLFAPLVNYRSQQPRTEKVLFGDIYRWQTPSERAEQVAADYENAIVTFFNLSENEFPRFDFILLGMGADGHTASLFPFSDALNVTDKIAVAVWVEKLGTTRLTLTFPAINNARNVMFLVKGDDKAETLRAVLRGGSEPEKFPSQNVKPENGELFWLTDGSAAKFLDA